MKVSSKSQNESCSHDSQSAHVVRMFWRANKHHKSSIQVELLLDNIFITIFLVFFLNKSMVFSYKFPLSIFNNASICFIKLKFSGVHHLGHVRHLLGDVKVIFHVSGKVLYCDVIHVGAGLFGTRTRGAGSSVIIPNGSSAVRKFTFGDHVTKAGE